MTVSTEWKRMFTVTFKDRYTGKDSVQMNVEEGTAATPPAWTRKGYTLSWSTAGYKNVTSDLTVNAEWLVSLTDNKITEPTYEKGDVVVIGNIRYKITNMKFQYVKVVGLKDAKVATVSIPDTVTFGGKMYYVKSIAKKTFRNNKSIQAVAVGRFVNTIGQYAFSECTNMRFIKIHSKGLTKVGLYSFHDTRNKLRVYVPEEKYVSKYRTRLRDGSMSVHARVKVLPSN